MTATQVRRSKARFSTLPLPLLLQILNQLPPSDLRRCATLSKSCTEPALACLHHALNLKYSDLDRLREASRYFRKLHTERSIYVHRLRIKYDRKSEELDEDQKADRDCVLAELFRVCTNVFELTLACSKVMTCSMPGPILWQALQRHRGLNTLHIDRGCLEMLQTATKQIPQLTDLTCTSVKIECRSHSIYQTNPLIRPALVSLDLIKCEFSISALQWLFRLCAGTLLHLRVDPFKAERLELRECLSTVGPRLQSLVLGKCSVHTEDRQLLELIAILCPRLVRLQLGLGWQPAVLKHVLSDSPADSTGQILIPTLPSSPVRRRGSEVEAMRPTSSRGRRLLIKLKELAIETDGRANAQHVRDLAVICASRRIALEILREGENGLAIIWSQKADFLKNSIVLLIGTSNSDLDTLMKCSRKGKSPVEDVGTLSLAQMSEEVLIHILTCLSPQDLGIVACLNQKWHRLSSDALVWRRLFMQDFSSSAELVPARLTSSPDWKALYRLQTNWQTGSVSTSSSLRNTVLAQPPTDMNLHSASSPNKPIKTEPTEDGFPVHTALRERPEHRPDTLVSFSGKYFFLCSKRANSSTPVPAVSLHVTETDGSTRRLGAICSSTLEEHFQRRPHLLNARALTITEMKIDDSLNTDNQVFRLAVFYSLGQATLLTVKVKDDHTYSVTEDYVALNDTTNSSADPIWSAKYRYPVLFTCSRNFTLSFYHITSSKTGQTNVGLMRAPLSSAACWRPMVLTLKPLSPHRFEAAIAYATPFFPSSWSVALQIFHLTLPCEESPSIEINTQSALCVPPPQFAHTSPLVTAIQYAHPYIVTSRNDNTIDLHEVISATDHDPMRIEYRRSLFGHTSSVRSISVAGSRCISGGNDGKVKVWTLGHEEDNELTTGRRKVRDLMVDVREPEKDAESDAEQGLSQWQKAFARRRQKGVEWLAFDSERVVMVSHEEDHDEEVKVLSFV